MVEVAHPTYSGGIRRSGGPCRRGAYAELPEIMAGFPRDPESLALRALTQMTRRFFRSA